MVHSLHSRGLWGRVIMKVPISWLEDYVDITVPVEELAERLTLAGLELASIYQRMPRRYIYQRSSSRHFEGSLGRHNYQVAGRYDLILGKKAGQVLTEDSKVITKIVPAYQTVVTQATTSSWIYGNMIANAELAYIFTDGGDHAGAIATHNVGEF